MSFFFFFFAFISGIRSYLIVLLLICSPPTTLEFPKYRSVVSISCQNSTSEFSLSLLSSPLYSWSPLQPAYYGGGRCSKKGEEQVRLWAALLWSVPWHPKESLFKRENGIAVYKIVWKSLAHTMKPRDLSISCKAFAEWTLPTILPFPATSQHAPYTPPRIFMSLNMACNFTPMGLWMQFPRARMPFFLICLQNYQCQSRIYANSTTLRFVFPKWRSCSSPAHRTSFRSLL